MTPEQRKHFKYVRDEMHGEAQPAVALEHEWLRGECVKCGASIERQEPVAWLHWLHGPVRLFLNKDEAMLELDRLNREYPVDKDVRQMKPLYTTPPQHSAIARKPLTISEIAEGRDDADPSGEDLCAWTFAKGVMWAERKHGIKE